MRAERREVSDGLAVQQPGPRAQGPGLCPSGFPQRKPAAVSHEGFWGRVGLSAGPPRTGHGRECHVGC